MNSLKRGEELKKLLTKKLLEKEYLQNRKGITLIAKETKCSVASVWKYLKRNQIPTRDDAKTAHKKWLKILTKEFLISKYVNDRKSKLQIAEEVGCDSATINNYLKKFNIKKRTQSESIKIRRGGSNRYIDGRTLKKYYCLDCGVELKDYQAKRCCSCAAKNRCKNSKNHWNWKDGKTSLYDKIRTLAETKKWRNAVYENGNYTCQLCGDNQGGNLNAHHKKPFAQILSEFIKEYSQLSPVEDTIALTRLARKWKPFWDVTNGETLCEDCHKNIKKLTKV